MGINVTIIEKRTYRDDKGMDKLVESKETSLYPENVDELVNCTRGQMAERIILRVSFTKKDIPAIMNFLNNSSDCFKQE